MRAILLALMAALAFPFHQNAQRSERGARIDDATLENPGSRPGDWLTHGRDYAETRFSPLNQINSANVNSLGLAWIFETGTTRGLEATPLVAGGLMYVTGSWSIVYALDPRTGKLIWKWDPKVPGAYGQRACCDVVNRGVALYKGLVYVGTLDGRLAALNAETGEPVWQVRTTDPDKPYTITGAPRIVKGKVIIGNGGAEYGVRGYVSAYDALTGRLVWRVFTVPGDPSKPFESPDLARASKTWNGEWWKYGGGGTVWDSLAYDPELDLLYVGTGNGSPWNQHIRSPQGGDNLYLCSILALKPDSGKMVWYYQVNPGESWDFTATEHMILADLEIGGRRRRVLMQAPKNGFFYVLDRTNGALISAKAIVPLNWATGIDTKTGRPLETPAARYSDKPFLMKPGPFGAHNWQPMSFDPITGLVYIPAQDTFFIYKQDQAFQYKAGAWNTGIDSSIFKDPVPPMPGAFLLAWDPIAEKERWRVPYNSIWNGGTLSTRGNLVFQGTADGRFVAYSADKGEKLWEFKAGSGIIAPPVTYEVDGKQYVSVMVGWGGSYALAGGSATGHAPPAGQLLTFALNGDLPAPSTKVQSREVAPIASSAPPEQISQGSLLYAHWCAVCHGIAAVSGGATPDLRYSAPSLYDSYPAVVLGGAFETDGMPSFQRWLTIEEVQAIRAYILKRRAEMVLKK